MLTWSSWLAEVGSESTLPGKAIALFSLASAAAVTWAIMKPEHNRELAETAVRDSGLGNAGDKIAKNHRKTLGLLRDLAGVKTLGVIAEYPDKGIVEIARPAGVVAALTPSTNPGATPANQANAMRIAKSNARRGVIG